jgi:hypothetical protein
MEEDACSRFLCNHAAAAARDHSSETLRRVCPELRTMLRLLCHPERCSYEIIQLGLGGRLVRLGRQGEGGRAAETCSLLYWKVDASQKRWSLSDCTALRLILYQDVEDLEDTDDLLIVVVNCKVEAEATNAGFRPAARRCVPVPLEALLYLESCGSRLVDLYAPRVVGASQVARHLGLQVEELGCLPLLFVDDPIVLCDLRSIRVGSFVYCPGSASALFRIVASCMRGP